MTALNLPLKAETYSELLDHYLATKQFTPAFEILERMPPTQVAFSRFLNACSERHEMERAEHAWKLMKDKGLPTTPVGYNLMLKGYGRMGNLSDALGMLRAMQNEGKGFEATESTFCSLLDANLSVSNLDGCLQVIREASSAGIAMNQVRIRRLVHSLCLQRRVEDAFWVFTEADLMEVDADVATCIDLIALAMQCHCPHRVPAVFVCISRRSYTLDVTSAHSLVRLLSQVDAFRDAQQVLNTLPRNATRADVGSYTELVSTAFRAGLGEDCMDLITELLALAASNKRPGVEFFSFCLSGFRLLKDPTSASTIFDVMERKEGLQPNYGCYKEIICCLLTARRFKQGSALFARMQKAAFEPERELVNVYITSFAGSKAQPHHELCWGMYSWAQAQKLQIEPVTLMAVFDSCDTHARLNRTAEVGTVMEGHHVSMGYKRHEQLKRARMLLATGNDGKEDKANTAAETRLGQHGPSRASSEEGSANGSPRRFEGGISPSGSLDDGRTGGFNRRPSTGGVYGIQRTSSMESDFSRTGSSSRALTNEKKEAGSPPGGHFRKKGSSQLKKDVKKGSPDILESPVKKGSSNLLLPRAGSGKTVNPARNTKTPTQDKKLKASLPPLKRDKDDGAAPAKQSKDEGAGKQQEKPNSPPKRIADHLPAGQVRQKGYGFRKRAQVVVAVTRLSTTHSPDHEDSDGDAGGVDDSDLMAKLEDLKKASGLARPSSFTKSPLRAASSKTKQDSLSGKPRKDSPSSRLHKPLNSKPLAPNVRAADPTAASASLASVVQRAATGQSDLSDTVKPGRPQVVVVAVKKKLLAATTQEEARKAAAASDDDMWSGSEGSDFD